MIKNSVVVLLVFLVFGCTNREKIVDKNEILSSDYRMFQNTAVWELAKAVWDQDVDKIDYLVKTKKTDINFQEPVYHKSLLMLTVLNHNYISFKKLLELGADPNSHDRYDGSSAIIDAAGINEPSGDNTSYLKLLLKFKADPNDIEVGKRRKDNQTRMTPLLKASGSLNRINSPLAKVKVLIAAGANVNYKSEFDQTALGQALLLDNYDVAVYLLNRGANYRDPIFFRDGKAIYIQNLLRESVVPLESKSYPFKKEVIQILKVKGIDYEKTAIPDYIVNEVKKKYPKNWKEYLNKY